MKERICRFLIIYATFVVIFLVAKPLFMALNADVYSGVGMRDVWQVIAAGLSMDLCMGAYLTVIPALMLIATVWTSRRWPLAVIASWRYFAVFMVVSTVVLDAILYGYWHFKLDTTPVFYFLTSPMSALASVSRWMVGAAIIIVAAATWGLGRLAGLLWRIGSLRTVIGRRRRVQATVALTLLTGALFIPIRGGFTVSTMNPSAAYFSTKAHMNHAAVNPMFSFMYSATHSSDFSSQFRYFGESELDEILLRLSTPDSIPSDSGRLKLLGVERPDIYIVILESFSAHLLPSLGGEAVAMRLDSIAREGVMFSNFYASSFRTDRAIPAILSGYPAQPGTSVMKFVDKAENLPSLSRTLIDSAGYRTEYYYGGDINFVNQKAYLVSSGFEKIVSDRDFPLSERLSKWGVHDDRLWDRMWADVNADTSATPVLRVIQTSSSHEPFEVPYTSHRHDDARAVAFEYADSCLGTFVDSLRTSGKWSRSLLVIVPDHWGAYPPNLSDPLARHHIPLVVAGGALGADVPRVLDMPGSQNDIAATLLGQLGIASGEFSMSHDMLSPAENHFAFFTEPDFAAVVTAADTIVVSTHEDESLIAGPDSSAVYPKALLQYLYEDLQKR